MREQPRPDARHWMRCRAPTGYLPALVLSIVFAVWCARPARATAETAPSETAPAQTSPAETPAGTATVAPALTPSPPPPPTPPPPTASKRRAKPSAVPSRPTPKRAATRQASRGTPTAPREPTFDFKAVVAKAEKLAKEPYQDTKGRVPEWLTKITYDQWRDIRFRPDQALWRGRNLPFQVQFFHPGLYYNRTVALNTVDAAGVHPLFFSPSQFDYGHNDFASKVPQDLGFAGFRLHAPIKKPDYYDEVIVFLGASYFRAVGKEEGFGASARGLAVDTALPSGEEFPAFKEFWIVTPAADAKEIAVYALLDSMSLTGAYRFTVQPGEQTAVHVQLQLFLRQDVKKIGMAPMTSMFFYGENSTRQVEDFRPEVHDSDGLLLNFNTGEWLWRPLDNPHTLDVSTFHMPNPQGFGLIQRDRNFDHYQDLETRADRRPSVWVVPDGGWGDGRAELVEIPTKLDANDNIVASWVPEVLPKPGHPFQFSYRSYWYADDPKRPPGGRVVATRRDRGTVEGAYRFVIDFSGPQLEALPADTVLRGAVTVASGQDSAELLNQQVVKSAVTGGWRLTFQVRPKKKEPIELRAYLDKGGEALTETWSYVILQ